MKLGRALSLLAVPLFGVTGCNAIESVTATTVVAGTLVRTPELQVQGRFDVRAEVLASAWVGERKNATDTGEPTPVRGADVNITFAGNRIPLPEDDSAAGFYQTNTVEDPDSGLIYMGGLSYTTRASLDDGSVAEYGGTVTAPTELSPAALNLSPTPSSMDIPPFGTVLVHPKSTALNVAWAGDRFGRYPYVSVFRARADDTSNPELVFDNRPESAGEIIEFILGTPPAEVDIPADTFAEDGLYGVVVVIMDKQDSLLPNTFLGSPVLAGSGAAVVLAVGTP